MYIITDATWVLSIQTRRERSLNIMKSEFRNTMATMLLAAVFSTVLAAVQPVRVAQITQPGIHTEGAEWYAHRRGLLFVDIAGQSLNFLDPWNNRLSTVTLDGPVTMARVLRGDDLAVSVGHELRVLNWAASNFSSSAPHEDVIATVEQDKPGNRFNDGNVDRQGRIWIGTMGEEKVVGQVQDDQASLFRVTGLQKQPIETVSARVDTVLSPVSISNGLVWNAAETLMYYIDTPTRRVDVFDFDAKKGLIANRRPAFDFAANNITGNPDGMTIDSNDNLWVACFGGNQVIRVDPSTGKLLRTVAIPASQVTAVALGEPSHPVLGDTLYVTSMRKGLSEEQLAVEPMAGSVFAVTGLGVFGAWRRQYGIGAV